MVVRNEDGIIAIGSEGMTDSAALGPSALALALLINISHAQGQTGQCT